MEEELLAVGIKREKTTDDNSMACMINCNITNSSDRVDFWRKCLVIIRILAPVACLAPATSKSASIEGLFSASGRARDSDGAKPKIIEVVNAGVRPNGRDA